MRITVEAEPFHQMAEMVGEAQPWEKRADATMRLVACHGRVCLECNHTVAGTFALVQQEGQCTVARRELIRILRALRDRLTLEITAEHHRLWIEDQSVRLHSYCPHAAEPAHFQIFFASELDLVAA